MNFFRTYSDCLLTTGKMLNNDAIDYNLAFSECGVSYPLYTKTTNSKSFYYKYIFKLKCKFIAPTVILLQLVKSKTYGRYDEKYST